MKTVEQYNTTYLVAVFIKRLIFLLIHAFLPIFVLTLPLMSQLSLKANIEYVNNGIGMTFETLWFFVLCKSRNS